MEAIIITAPLCEETEAIATIDVLRRGGIKVKIAGPVKGIIQASRGLKFVVDYDIKDLFNQKSPDAIILPGGLGGVKAILENHEILDFITKLYHENKIIAAICAAPLILEKCHILDNCNIFTSHPAVKEKFSSENIRKYSQERVVIDNNIITSRSPGTAIEFGLSILTKLKSKKIAITVNKGLLSQIPKCLE